MCITYLYIPCSDWHRISLKEESCKCLAHHCFFLFFKLYFTVITLVLIFPFSLSIRCSLLPQIIPPPLFMSMGHVYKFFGYSMSYTVLYILMAIL